LTGFSAADFQGLAGLPATGFSPIHPLARADTLGGSAGLLFSGKLLAEKDSNFREPVCGKPSTDTRKELP